MENLKEQEWTVIYLIRSAPPYWNNAKEMLFEIAGKAIHDDTSVVVWLDTLHKFHDELVPIGSNGANNRMMTMFYSLEKSSDDASPTSQWKRLEAKPDHEYNIRSHSDLTNYFKDYILDQHPAKRYLLFTWDHGAGYVIFNDGDSPSAIGEKENVLSMANLAKAITNASVHGKPFKVDVAIMMNCFMQLFDTGFELSLAKVDYLVSSENSGSFLGFNYKEIFGALFERPANVTPKELAILAVESLNTKVIPAVFTDDPLQNTAYFATDLQLYNAMDRLIDQLSAALMELPDDAIMSMNNGLTYVSPHRTIDFSNFIEAVVHVMGNDWEKELIAKINALKKSLIIATYYGKKIRMRPRKIPTGFSIGFVIRRIERNYILHNQYMRSRSPLASTFTLSNKWSQFIERYLQLLLEKASFQPMPE